jgi:hypothetical protein
VEEAKLVDGRHDGEAPVELVEEEDFHVVDALGRETDRRAASSVEPLDVLRERGEGGDILLLLLLLRGDDEARQRDELQAVFPHFDELQRAVHEADLRGDGWGGVGWSGVGWVWGANQWNLGTSAAMRNRNDGP